MRFSTVTGLAAALLPSLCRAWLSTDTLQDADIPQSGYLPNHNMDPARLGGMTLNWSLAFNSAEQHLAKPLVWTPPGGGNEMVILVSNQNFIRVIDGITGVLKYSRQLDQPFSASDASCGDIPTTIGITATPLIDKNTNIMYFTSKGYKNGAAGPQGLLAGQYKLYAVTLPGLQDIAGWPYILPNKPADNDLARYFIAGTVLQRTGLVQVGNSIILGFGGHCDNFNYTGLLVSVSKTTGVGLTGMQATIAAPGAPPQSLNLTDQDSGMAGIWQSGMALAVDEANSRVFFATGNTHGAGVNKPGTARSGKTYISTLEQSVANYGVDPATGNITQQDWWQAVNYDDYNGGDRDLSSSGVVLLDPFFSGGGINRVAVAAGKNGIVYFLDADNLGGFKMGAGGTDAILQQLGVFTNSFFSGVANYPLEGGYIYFAATGNVLMCYQYTPGSDGKPFFTYAGQSTTSFAAKGVPVVTTLNGQPGTGIVWLADVNMGIVAYNAIPVNGTLVQIPLGYSTGRLQKNMRPVFGNGRLYAMANTKIFALANKNAASGTGASTTVGSSSTSTSSIKTSTSTSISSSSSSTSTTLSTSILPSTTSTTSTSTSSTSSTSTSSPSTSSTSTSSPSTSSTSISSPSTSSTFTSSTTASSTSSVSSSSVVTSTSTSSTSVSSTSTSATPASTVPVQPATIGTNWTYYGCYTEATTGRALSLKTFSADTMTLDDCSAFCASYGYQMFGVEYARECYCGNVLMAGSVSAPQTECSKVCKGNALEYCGGSKRLSVYTKAAVVVSSSSTSLSGSTSSSISASLSSSISSFSTSTTPVSTSSTTSSTSTSTSTGPSTTSSTTGSVSTSSSSIASSSTTSPTSTSPSSTVIPSRACTPSIPAGKLITLNWNITWVNAAPDGFARRFVGINGQWPNPAITATLGDIIKINVVNGLGDQHTSIHFHGLFQQNTTFEDGPVGVTQCPIAPGQSFVYQFRLLQTGTYWYHAHIGGQYIDGFRGPLIIKDPCAPYKADAEMTLTLSDLYHQEAPPLINYYLSADNSDTTGGVEPVPDAALINEGQNTQFPVVAGKTYMVHIINMGAMAGMYLQFDQHRVTVIEADGVWVNPYDTAQLFVAVAQRYTVLLTAKASSPTTNYAIVATMNPDMFGDISQPANPSVAAYLVYSPDAPLPSPFTLVRQAWDDMALSPFDPEPVYSGSITQIFLTVSFGTDGWDSTRAMFNGQTYVSPKVPTMFTALSAPADVLSNPVIYGRGTNPYVIPFGDVVEVHINNHDDRAHPFHLHGHTFQVLDRPAGSNEAMFPGLDDTPASPMRRDTVVVYGDSTATIRFKADNPGIWLFHCHTEWHVESGLTATFIEAPDVFVARAPYIPNSHKTVCDALGISRKGNAAGNSKTGQWLNLTGQNLDAGDPSLNFGAMVSSTGN